MSAADRSTKPLARLWWWLLPSTGFFAYPDMTTRRERLRWWVPYRLWKLVNRFGVDFLIDSVTELIADSLVSGESAPGGVGDTAE